MKRYEIWAFLSILAVAVVLRLQGLFHDLPFTYYGDEMHFVKRSMALGSGDLNPHWFHKPALLMYMLLGAFGMMFVGGKVAGVYASPEAFGAAFLADPGPFLLAGRLVVFAFGLGCVFLAWRIGRRTLGTGSGLVGALGLALLPAMVNGSQMVKADVPSAFFVAAAAWAYLSARESDRLRPVILAGLLAGASMGTKYYGVIALPGIVLAELLSRAERGRSWGTLVGRVVLLGFVFVAGFFITSPYNFLDPLWGESIRSRLSDFVSVEWLGSDAAFAAGVGEDGTRFDPDSGVEYQPGWRAIPGAALHFWGRLTDVRALGLGFTLLALAGMASMLRSRESRWNLAVLGAPAGVFLFFAVTLMAYHVNPRQLNAIFPLLAPLFWPGACLLASPLRRFGDRAVWSVAAVLFVVAAVPMLQRTVHVNRVITRPDSRNASVEWILANIPPTEKILLDDYGPILVESPTAVGRLEERLRTLPGEEAFTGHQTKRLELLRAYPAEHARDFEQLGHPWWLNSEISDEEIRASKWHRDMGNPLLDRTPATVADYRARGFRWIITNSEAQERYAEPGMGEAFPSFARFYAELAELSPAWSFDPAREGGKGPRVDVYRLEPSDG